jgi:riboflavin biosynthesis pyrimidine reductase
MCRWAVRPSRHTRSAGLVDEYYLFVVPMMIGGGKRVLPTNVCATLDLRDERRFAMEWSIFAIARYEFQIPNSQFLIH